MNTGCTIVQCTVCTVQYWAQYVYCIMYMGLLLHHYIIYMHMPPPHIILLLTGAGRYIYTQHCMLYSRRWEEASPFHLQTSLNYSVIPMNVNYARRGTGLPKIFFTFIKTGFSKKIKWNDLFPIFFKIIIFKNIFGSPDWACGFVSSLWAEIKVIGLS